MSGELLLHWLSHLGEGTWNKVREAATGVSPPDSDVRRKLQFWRNCLSDLGHVDFFVDGSQRWRVRQPVLAGLCGFEGVAVLCGARSPKIVQTLEWAVEKHGCRFEVNALPDLPPRVVVAGEDEQIGRVARECRLHYIAQYSEMLCHGLTRITATPGGASDEPAGWRVRSFDLGAQRWVEGRLPKSAREYESRYGVLRYYWCDRQNGLRPAPKREAIYASAAVQCVTLACYDGKRRSLMIPAAAPLPEDYMRAACLCSGVPPRYEAGIWVFESVPPFLASILLVSVGQPHPGVPMIRPEGFKEALEAHG